MAVPPHYLYGGNIRVDYRNVDFGLVFQGVGKRNSRLSRINSAFAKAFGNVPKELIGNFWSKNNKPEQNLQARYPRLSTRSISNNYEMSDFWLIDGSYFRIKNLTLGYTIRPELIKRTGIQSLRIYISANDVFAKHNLQSTGIPQNHNSAYPMVTTIIWPISHRSDSRNNERIPYNDHQTKQNHEKSIQHNYLRGLFSRLQQIRSHTLIRAVNRKFLFQSNRT